MEAYDLEQLIFMVWPYIMFGAALVFKIMDRSQQLYSRIGLLENGKGSSPFGVPIAQMKKDLKHLTLPGSDKKMIKKFITYRRIMYLLLLNSVLIGLWVKLFKMLF